MSWVLRAAGVVFGGLLLAGTSGAEPTPTSDDALVVAAVQRFFDTVAACDTEGLRAVVEPEARFYNVRPGPDGAPVINTFDLAEFMGRLQPCKERLLERMWDPQVRVHGRVATLWTAYDFWRGDTFSHCGMDGFDLVRTPSGWRITGGVYTVEPQGCSPSPLGPPPPAPPRPGGPGPTGGQP